MTPYLKTDTLLQKNCYRIIDFIGQGGFGITYLAEEIGLFKKSGFGEEYIKARHPEKVVVKELYFTDFCNRQDTGLVSITSGDNKEQFEKLVNKLLEEGQTLKKLDHEHIVKTRDIFRENDTAYMVMDYIEGESLEHILKTGGKLELDKANSCICQILSSVIYIHSQKILHLDITPSNILIQKNSGQPVLIDFGSSLAYKEDNHIATHTSKLVAGRSKHYAPVEQDDIDNLKEFDPTFDIYAIGATLYHLVTGSPPPVASLLVAGRRKLILPSVVIGDSAACELLDQIITKALNSQYHQRYKTAFELNQDLEKERDYRAAVSAIQELLSTDNTQQALSQTEEAIKQFGNTQTLTALENECEAGVYLPNGNKQDVWKYYWQNRLYGDNSMIAGDWEKAEKYYSNGLKRVPDDTFLLQQLSISRQKIEEHPKLTLKMQLNNLTTQLHIFRNQTQLVDKLNDKNYWLERKKKLDEIGVALATIGAAISTEPEAEGPYLILREAYKKEDAEIQQKIKALETGFARVKAVLSAPLQKLITLCASSVKRLYIAFQDPVNAKKRWNYIIPLILIILASAVLIYQHQSRGRKYYLKALAAKDTRNWLNNMLLSAHCDYDSAYSQLGNYYNGLRSGPEYISACYYYMLSAEAGDNYGELQIGLYYYNGMGGLSQNDTLAVKYFALSADQDNIASQNNMGAMYYDGKGGLTKDRIKAIKLYQLAAAKGFGQSCFNLASIYRTGIPELPKNDSIAVIYYLKAYDKDKRFINALDSVGDIYYNGEGNVQEGDSIAAKYYNMIVDKDGYAKWRLATMYLKGYGGLTIDSAKARELASQSCDNKCNQGCDLKNSLPSY